MPKNLQPIDEALNKGVNYIIPLNNPELILDLTPTVFWKSDKPDPYEWLYLVVELALFSDPCGCRRRRLREHSERYRSRFGMYYQTFLDPFMVDVVDPRCVLVPANNTMFVGKLYADQTTLSGQPDAVGNRLEAQRKLTLEFVWLIRPCDEHGPPLSDLRRRGCGLTEPEHMNNIL